MILSIETNTSIKKGANMPTNEANNENNDNASEAARTMPSNWWSTPTPGPVALRAMEFGYGSRAAYGTHRAWEDLEGHLRSDWRESGGESECPWDEVGARVVRRLTE